MLQQLYYIIGPMLRKNMNRLRIRPGPIVFRCSLKNLIFNMYLLNLKFYFEIFPVLRLYVFSVSA